MLVRLDTYNCDHLPENDTAEAIVALQRELFLNSGVPGGEKMLPKSPDKPEDAAKGIITSLKKGHCIMTIEMVQDTAREIFAVLHAPAFIDVEVRRQDGSLITEKALVRLLSDLFVRPEQRGQGMARTLIKHVEDNTADNLRRLKANGRPEIRAFHLFNTHPELPFARRIQKAIEEGECFLRPPCKELDYDDEAHRSLIYMAKEIFA